MPPGMATARATALLTALALVGGAVLLAISASTAASPAPASASASGCSGVSLSASSRTVRRGGRVLLKGEACGASYASAGTARVQVRLRKNRKWTKVAKAVAAYDGSFSVCAKLKVPKRSRFARLRATGPGGASGKVTVRIAKKGGSGCRKGASGGSGDSADDSYVPPPPEQGNPQCPLSQPGSTIGMTLPAACTQLAADTASNPDPIPFWGRLDCASATRHQQLTAGGADPHPTGSGAAQPDSAFRRMTVIDGDDVWGERCEAGLNDQGGPTALFHEGQRRVTFASIRLPASSPVGNPNWRTVLQMKQAQPYHNPNGASMFELQVRGGEWIVISDWTDLWTTPAQQNTWTRFAFDIVYSQDPALGSVKVYVDLNGDGDAEDSNEQSPVIHRQTLRPEVAGGPSPVPVGQSIPSHLRAGIYQNTNYSCPSGCSADIDNIQVFRP